MERTNGSGLRRGRLSRRSLLAQGLALGGGIAGAGMLGGTVPSSAAAAAAVQPKTGGTFICAQEVDPISLDPHTDSNFSALQAFEHIYESLTQYDEKMNIIPCLAQSWEVQNGGKAWVFHLRPNVKFHNGQVMTADDVKYTIDRVLDPKTASPWFSWFDQVADVRVVDPLTLQVNMKSPYPGLLGSFAGMRASGVMPKGYAEKTNLKVQAIGTGPFKLVEYVAQDHITYAKNPDYWDKPYPYLDGMVFKILTDENTRLAALRAGQVHFAMIYAQDAQSMQGVPGVSVLHRTIANVTLHYINVSQKPLNDARVRKALRMAVDTNEVIQKAAFGQAVPSGPVPTGYGDWYLDPKVLPYTKPDVEGAKKLLAEAGYPNGTGLSIQLKCSPLYPQYVATTLVVQDSLKKIGVDAQVVQEEWGAFVADHNTELRSGGKEGGQIFCSGNTFRPDPDGYIFPYFHSTGTLNDGGYRNPKLDGLMLQARSIFNHDQRRSLYVEIQQTLLAESPNWYWYVAYNFEAMSTKVQGFTQSFTQRRMAFKKTWLSG